MKVPKAKCAPTPPVSDEIISAVMVPGTTPAEVSSAVVDYEKLYHLVREAPTTHVETWLYANGQYAYWEQFAREQLLSGQQTSVRNSKEAALWSIAGEMYKKLSAILPSSRSIWMSKSNKEQVCGSLLLFCAEAVVDYDKIARELIEDVERTDAKA